jgi:hypothetical protein
MIHDGSFVVGMSIRTNSSYAELAAYHLFAAVAKRNAGRLTIVVLSSGGGIAVRVSPDRFSEILHERHRRS